MKTRFGFAPGFTLIEVLVALLIVALGMGAAFKALNSAAENTIQLRERTFAAWVGFNQLAAARLQPGLPANGTQQHDVEFAGSRWHWQQTIEDMQLPGVQRITIQIRHADDEQAPARGTPGEAAGKYWLATVVGFRGNALMGPQSELPGWDDGSSGPPQDRRSP